MSETLVAGFGLYNFSISELFRPASVEELSEMIASLVRRGEPFVFRGAGRSYGPVATNPRGAVIDLTQLRKLEFLDSTSGLVRAQAGVFIGDIWRASVPLGFWPFVVPGTMNVSMGGAVSANIHGKNHYRRGSFAEYLESITVLSEDGTPLKITKDDPRIQDFVGGYGAAGAIVEIELKLKPVQTGYFDVEGFTLPDLATTLDCFEEGKEKWEYQVAWVDCYPSGRNLGRAAVHLANHTPESELPRGSGLDLATQEVPGKIFGVVPKSLLATALSLANFKAGMQLVNLAKFASGRLLGRTKYRQPLVHFNFLLDAIPDWQRAYRPGGFIQYQIYVPKERALAVLTEAIRLQHRFGVPSNLGVLKRHRKDRFRNAYTPDGYSLALDFPVTSSNAPSLIQLCRRYDEIVAEAGGAVYRAKDCIGSYERSMNRKPPPLS